MHKPVHFKANRGGHAPGYLRDAFTSWVDSPDDVSSLPDDCEYDGEQVPVKTILGLLWNCIDIMPSETCGALEISPGATYAQGVRLAKQLRAES